MLKKIRSCFRIRIREKIITPSVIKSTQFIARVTPGCRVIRNVHNSDYFSVLQMRKFGDTEILQRVTVHFTYMLRLACASLTVKRNYITTVSYDTSTVYVCWVAVACCITADQIGWLIDELESGPEAIREARSDAYLPVPLIDTRLYLARPKVIGTGQIPHIFAHGAAVRQSSFTCLFVVTE